MPSEYTRKKPIAKVVGSDSGQHSIRELLPRHHRIIELCLEGKTRQDICTLTEIGGRQLSYLMASPNFQHELALQRSKRKDIHNDALEARVIQQNPQEILDDAATQAAQKLVDQMLEPLSNESELHAVESILDRTGHGRQTKQDIQAVGLSIKVKPEQFETMKETLEMLREDARNHASTKE